MNSHSHLHATTGRWRLGLGLSLIAALHWGLLPIALKGLLNSMDAYTVTWYRFAGAALVLGVIVLRRNGLSIVSRILGSSRRLLLVAILGLCGNYIVYVLGLDRVTPSTATVVIQLAPAFLLFGSLIVFKEPFGRVQWVGLAVLVWGMLLFFNHQLKEMFSGLGGFTSGVLLIIAAAATWAAYALAQKQLLTTLSSGTIMLLIYLSGSVVFFPHAEPGQLSELNAPQVGLLAFCVLNTLLAYGSFAEALNHLEASRVSMVLAIMPLITVGFMVLTTRLLPDFLEPENLSVASVLGAALVVLGSVLGAARPEDGSRKLRGAEGGFS